MTLSLGFTKYLLDLILEVGGANAILQVEIPELGRKRTWISAREGERGKGGRARIGLACLLISLLSRVTS